MAKHHVAILQLLESLALKTLYSEKGVLVRNAMILAPPGSAKSTYTSVVFPTWLMGKFADYRTILASYATPIARKQGRRARQIARSPRFRAIWSGTTLSDDSAAAHEWALTNGSEFMAGGIQSGITGNRAKALIIDDPVANREEADSKTVRDKIRDEYDDSLLTRLTPDAIVLLMMTRWNEDDLAGSILPADWKGESGFIECRDGQVWYVLCIPAEARNDDALGRKPGELLWPEWFTPEHFNRYRVNARTWSALFQQMPTPEDGDFFKREWFHIRAQTPPIETMKIYMGSDYATTEDGGDYTVHVVVGIDPQGDMWILDLWREQATSDVWVEVFCDLVLQYHPSQTAEESGQIKAGVGPFLSKRMRERKAHTWRHTFPTRHDKSTRAQSFRAFAASRGINIPEGAKWWPALLSELLVFPGGKHDDQVDALGLVGQLLDRIASGKEPTKPDTTPKQVEYTATPEGVTVSNMDIKQQVQDFIRRQKKKRDR